MEEGGTTARIYGRVLSPGGEPLAGADVTLTRFGSATLFFAGPEPLDRAGDLSTKTDKSGAFEFASAPPFNQYTLIARHADYATVERGPIDAPEGSVVQQELTLSMGLRLFGQIRDTQGNVVPNADIRLTPVALGAAPAANNPDLRSMRSDNTGHYEFLHCAEGTFVLTVSAEGYGQATVQNLPLSGAEVERNVDLQVALFMAGRVVDENNNGIVGARVEAISMNNAASRTQSSTTSVADGKFEFSDVAAGSYVVRATAEGYKMAILNRANAGEVDLLVQLVPLPTVSGQVLDADGNPLTSYTINLRQPLRNSDLTMFVQNSRKQINDPQGRYKLVLPMAGEFMTEASAGGYAPTRSEKFTAADGQNLENITIRMTTGGVIRGRLVDKSGKGIAGAMVKTENNEWQGGDFDLSFGEAFPGHSTKKSVRTGDDGVFVLRGLAPTQYLLQFNHPDRAQNSIKNVVVTNGTETNIGDVLLEAGSSVRGVVRGPGGAPLSGATVQLTLNSQTEFPLSHKVHTNAQGEYTITGIRSGTYSIMAGRPSGAGDNPFAGAGDMNKTRREIVIDPDGTYQGQDFEIQD
ncbi:MAG: carboxypeptidase-like regulatory domain-containing protein [Planctomycetota bacterium]